MQDDAKSYLKRKAKQLDLDRGDALKKLQAELDAQYAGKTRVVSLNDGVLKVQTPSAGVASELRLNQVALLKDLEAAASFKYPIKRLYIQITSIPSS